jgi:hypothetical protein
VAGAPELPGVLGSLAPLLDNYGYLAVAGLIVLEDFGVPAPGETVLIAGAVYAGAGHPQHRRRRRDRDRRGSSR